MRTKSVFKSSELPHVWFHQQALAGRCCSAISFTECIIYSYTTKMGCIYPERDAVILNNKHYSNTTTGHQSAIRRAIPATTRTFYGPSDNVDTPTFFVRDLMRQAMEAQEKAEETQRDYPRRKAVIAKYQAKCLYLLNTAQEVNAFFELSENPTLAGVEEMRAAQEQRAKQEREAAAKRERAAALRAKKNLREWLAGEDIHTHYMPSGQTYLRINAAGNVETSKGITIERNDAIQAMAFVFGNREHGWQYNAVSDSQRYVVNGYMINSISADGVVAGCHRISWKELERIKALLAA